ncbi:hypothetical protein ASPWEDRAFT_174830 [Aspergillus wentii DTO 134E9]|uniref:Fungal lipase-type domain-containing protein n=1 Tax=Aspergillus wentii DTO 134E9 TaxID=1073089 RepID=A0A1L9REY4_ASPWE|nr:uncharacterized protein ASPWEDRAFT_174830 [Aspergillus wentii DTO 134E9]OJJ33423.1 hypothetical protein ASPWEDRAFT_174830 [Aspergillus wentii DTO 134E9]
MKRLLKIVQRNPRPTASALRASAAPPSSGFTFVDHSQGASAAVSEFSAALGTVLEQIDLDDDINSQMKVLTERLDQEASRYDNCQLNDVDYTDWSCSQEQAELISVAWKCAHDSYNASSSSHPFQFENCILTLDHVVTPSTSGTVKAVTFTIVTPKGCSNKLLPVLIIAIRGTASRVDHMVNINNEPRNAASFINTSFQPESASSLEAHSGFLESAVALDSIVSKRIEEYKQRGGHVLFTGHSAGGAVASLLFLRYLSQQNDSIRFSCLTFGAPPTITLPLSIPSKTICLNIINEFDLVTRADKPYMLSILNLVRSIYNQDPLSDTDECPSPTEASSKGTFWPTPRAMYHHVGEKIVFLMRLQDKSEDLQLRAVNVSTAQFEKLLFCRVSVHRRACYEQRVKLFARSNLQ